jgi:hypothetical protein
VKKETISMKKIAEFDPNVKEKLLTSLNVRFFAGLRMT